VHVILLTGDLEQSLEIDSNQDATVDILDVCIVYVRMRQYRDVVDVVFHCERDLTIAPSCVRLLLTNREHTNTSLVNNHHMTRFAAIYMLIIVSKLFIVDEMYVTIGKVHIDITMNET
jgi:hypothetical protein